MPQEEKLECLVNKRLIRSQFKDFRYVPSTDEPNILREFVRYDDVIETLKKIHDGAIEFDETASLSVFTK